MLMHSAAWIWLHVTHAIGNRWFSILGTPNEMDTQIGVCHGEVNRGWRYWKRHPIV